MRPAGLFQHPQYIRHQRRTAITDFWSRRSGQNKARDASEPGSKPNPVLEEFERQNPKQPNQRQQAPAQGDLAPSSIFEADRRAQQQQQQQEVESADVAATKAGPQRDPNNMLRVLDPDPNARERWERKKVIQMMKKGGRLTKAQFIKRTERENLAKSENFKTSTKKLGMLARQISGKTIDDAITQMRFSKKKIANEVLKHLEYARDEAIVKRGMGLGQIEAPDSPSKIASAPVQIQLKDGKRHTVDDPSTIYIDQAWVGRGPYGQLPDYRARGRVFVMRPPYTSLSVVLKEEATRLREFEEREEKRRRERLAKVWTPLPDRPIQGQRQWYSW